MTTTQVRALAGSSGALLLRPAPAGSDPMLLDVERLLPAAAARDRASSDVRGSRCPARRARALAEHRVRDRDQPSRPLADARAAHLGDAVLGHHAVDDLLERR